MLNDGRSASREDVADRTAFKLFVMVRGCVSSREKKREGIGTAQHRHLKKGEQKKHVDSAERETGKKKKRTEVEDEYGRERETESHAQYCSPQRFPCWLALRRHTSLIMRKYTGLARQSSQTKAFLLSPITRRAAFTYLRCNTNPEAIISNNGSHDSLFNRVPLYMYVC
jgi:hypothetical protein